MSVSGFRAFSQTVHFQLDADVILVDGPNGTGKTSFFDAILWGLTGQLSRLDDPGQGPVSLYSKSGQASVQLVLADHDGTTLEISRLHSGEHESLNLVAGDQEFTGSEANIELLRRVWPAATATDNAMTVLATALTRSVYLQQDLVREFLERDSAESRFEVIAELMGAGRLNEFMLELERASRAWSRARAEPAQRVQELSRRLSNLETRSETLSDRVDQAPTLSENWDSWWATTLNFGLPMEIPSFGSMGRESLIEQALGFLRGERQTAERRAHQARTLLADMNAMTPPSQDDQAKARGLEEEARRLQEELAPLHRELARLQAEAARERAEMVRRKGEMDELRTLASIALRHLEGNCPTCGQAHDENNTRHRLESLLGSVTDEPAQAASKAAAEVAQTMAQIEQKLNENRSQLGELQSKLRGAELAAQEFESRLRDLGIDDQNNARDRLEQLAELEEGRSRALDSQYRQGEALTLTMTRASEVAQRVELQRDLANVSQSLASAKDELAKHDDTGELAKRILAELREASEELVSREVKRVEPAVARIYSRMDPHPAFKTVELLTSFSRGHGRITAVVGDAERNVVEKNPLPLFSSSQLNALAVSVFLGLNLGISSPPLEAILLDDPLQSLDDVNLLGLIDTLRRTKALRQLVVSTHDHRLSDLLQLKLRPVGEGESTLVISISDWTREGPSILQSSLPTSVESSQVA